MEIHEAAAIMPLDEEHIPDLAADIKASGLIDPIETLDGKVIDGRRRLRACEVAGVQPRFKAIATVDPVAYVLSKQNRRDLTPSQRAMIGARATALWEKLEGAARERHSEAVAKSNRARASVPLVEPVPPMDTDHTKTRDQIGKLVRVSGRTISDATKVLEKGVPELAKAVDEGRIAVKTAAVLASEPEDVQRAEITNPKRNRQYKSGPLRSALVQEVAEPTSDESAVVDDGRAIRLAHKAINELMQIQRSDPRRSRAFQMVRDWMKNNT